MLRQRSDAHRARALGLGLGLAMALPASWPLAPLRASEGPREGLAADPEVVIAQQDFGQLPDGPLGQGIGGRPLVPGTDLTREELEQIDEQLLANILRIEDPVDRSLALVQAAIYKIQTRDLDTARRALDRASEAIEEISEPVRRDLRLISTSRAFIELAQEDINVAVSGAASILSLEPEMTVEERVQTLERALEAFERSAELASRIEQLGYRPQTMYLAAEAQAKGGQDIGIVAFRNPQILGEQQETVVPELRRLAARYIELAAEHARSIDVPVWRDVALSAVASSAAVSNQFELGRQVAGSIPGLELRFDAVLSVAEGEARRGDPDRATGDFAECARILASIPIDDLRGTLNDVLIESLIAAGRFPDARRCIALYPDDVDRLEALGGIAQAMGARGLSDEARQWILREIEPQYRSGLYRRVNDGVLSTLERYPRGSDAYGAF
ncbi:tetratricopeptide repeat protein [Tautonia sociabilis]|uniref:Tetratricopeptide repeat protein n=1 Tax=Tautonia sociabilis TaxID=2080755 RepID=A0A432MDN7_9BACT|nr:hypothetical protein [Tautonia sociabilis]RUL82954.1 hypothetical protein TsocGM_22920 [Tautonia sociabilis]